MKQNDYWERFLVSGSVADYLKFRAECAAGDAQAQRNEMENRDRVLIDTVREHAGFSDGYRNDLKIDSGR